MEVAHLRDTLQDALDEFEELMRSEEWFVTEVVDRITTSLELLNIDRMV